MANLKKETDNFYYIEFLNQMTQMTEIYEYIKKFVLTSAHKMETEEESMPPALNAFQSFHSNLRKYLMADPFLRQTWFQLLTQMKQIKY